MSSAAFKQRLLQHRKTVSEGTTSLIGGSNATPSDKKQPTSDQLKKPSTPKAPKPEAAPKSSTSTPITPQPAINPKKRKQESTPTTPAKQQQQTPAKQQTPTSQLANKRTLEEEGNKEEKTPTAKKQKKLSSSQRRNKRKSVKKNANKTADIATTTAAGTTTSVTPVTATTPKKKSEKKSKKKKTKQTKAKTATTPTATTTPKSTNKQASSKKQPEAKKGPQDWAAKASSMQEQLLGAQFRWINEKMYSCSSEDAVSMMEQDPELFDAYHKGYRAQVKKWPVNPLDLAIKLVRAHPAWEVGDFGCGDGRLAESVGNKVHSFDLVAAKPHITACNIAKVPLEAEVLDAAVFCLSLMGTDYMEFVAEAHRTLKLKGSLIVAEVQSRFQSTSVSDFTSAVESVGFKRESLDDKNPFFVFLTFTKSSQHAKRTPDNTEPAKLKPCQYKKR